MMPSLNWYNAGRTERCQCDRASLRAAGEAVVRPAQAAVGAAIV